MVDQYIFSGSLPENASTYVTREADAQLYEGLKAGKFCYVLNSRQSGKSSLRVRTMQRLREEGVQCAAVDLSAGGIQNVPPEQWYADLIDTLIDSFGLDVDFGDWWETNQLNTLVTRFRKFLEEVLLVEVQENIVIFIDEIDSVLSLNFPTDDFFALIRACYNKRVDNPEYNRLTFCLLGVASPSNLIEDKQRTPFNIGQAISLKGFQLHEVEPLEKGLYGKFSSPQTIMQEILQWTGGQPFLTQKLCQFMVEESEQLNSRSVEQVVRLRIIENWESQDEPEHLRTIQDRILRDEKRTGRLLELYQQILTQGKIKCDDSPEQIEIRLSGLVVKQDENLVIYNQIYKFIFNQNWILNELTNLRSLFHIEAINAWEKSGRKDESRLLTGQALKEVEAWARNKALSDQDTKFINASREYETNLERQKREIAEQANQILSKANKKAKRSIYILLGGIFIIFGLVFTLLQRIKVANEATNLEQSGINTLRQFEFNEIEALISAINDGQNLRKLVEKSSFTHKYPTVKPLLALQKILSNIHEQNQFALNNDKIRILNITFSSGKIYTVTAEENGSIKIWEQPKKLLITLPTYQYLEINNASFSPDGKKLLILSIKNREAKLDYFDLSGKLLNTSTYNIEKNEKMIWNINFSPDGEFIAITGENGVIRIWDLSKKTVTRLKPFSLSSIINTSFSLNGQHIATVEYNNQVKIWDFLGRHKPRIITERALSVNFSLDGQHIITGGRDGKVKIWNLLGQLVDKWETNHFGVKILSFSPNGRFLATTGWEGTVKVWDYSSRKQLVELKTHQSNITSLVFSSDSKRIASIDQLNNTIKVWNWNKGNSSIKQSFKLDIPSNQCFNVASFSQDKNTIAYYKTYDNKTEHTVILSNILGDKIVHLKGFNNQPMSIGFNRDGERIAVIDFGGNITIWDRLGNRLEQWNSFTDKWDSKSNKWITNSDFKSKHLRDFIGIGINFVPDIYSDSQVVSKVHNNSPAKKKGIQKCDTIYEIDGHSTSNISVSVLENAVKGAKGKAVNFKFIRQGKNNVHHTIIRDKFYPLKTDFEVPNFLNTLSISPNGRFVAVALDKGVIKLWDLTNKEKEVELKVNSKLDNQNLDKKPRNRITSLNFSPDGKYLVEAKENGRIYLWEWNSSKSTFELEKSWNSYQTIIKNIRFSPNNKLIATTGGRSTILWSISGDYITQLQGHQENILGLDFSKDANLIVTAGVDGKVMLWTALGQQIAEYNYKNPVLGVGLSSDGKSFTTIELDGTVQRQYIQELEELLLNSCRWLQDYFVTHPKASKVCSE
jgi:WD40 repeat protein